MGSIHTANRWHFGIHACVTCLLLARLDQFAFNPKVIYRLELPKWVTACSGSAKAQAPLSRNSSSCALGAAPKVCHGTVQAQLTLFRIPSFLGHLTIDGCGPKGAHRHYR